MANITENTQNPAWSNGIYQIETSDPVLGGANGIANRQAKELAARTQWLKTELAKAVSSIGTNKSSADSAIATKANNTLTLTAGNGLTGGGNLTANRTFALGTPSSITASTTNSVTADSHTHAVDKASTSVAGIVQLNNTLTSTATNQALTAAQGKVLNENILNAIKNGLQFKGIIGSKNLNDLFGAENYGIWQCLQNVNASEEQNYPVLKAGALIVIPSTNQGTQIYIPYSVYRIYIRYSKGDGVLSNWYTLAQAINNLNSTSTFEPLSAAQGKVLNDKITANASDTTTNLATKANNTVTLTAGNGLSGGGNLTANRTFTLGTPSSITASTTNSVTADSHTHAVDKASTSVAGIVQLNNTLTSTATNQALTAAQGKVLNDKIANIKQFSTKTNVDIDNLKEPCVFASPVVTDFEKFPINQDFDYIGFAFGYNGEMCEIVNNARTLYFRNNESTGIPSSDWTDWYQILTTYNAYKKDEFAIKKSQNGYCKLPNGLIFQWGIATILNEGVGDINFNIAFPNAVYIVQLNEMTTTGRSIAGAPDEIIWDKTVTTTEKFNIKSTEKIGQFAWFAIGI